MLLPHQKDFLQDLNEWILPFHLHLDLFGNAYHPYHNNLCEMTSKGERERERERERMRERERDRQRERERDR